MILNGTLTSKWDGNAARFDTKATLNTETGAVTSLETIEGEELEDLCCLTDEYFTDENRVKYPVCSHCHEYITNEDGCRGGCEHE